MALFEDEVVAAVAATAAVLSPRVRKVARKGVVYGLAGALKAGDIAVAAARGAARAAQATEATAPRSAKPSPPAEQPSTRPGQERSTRSRSRSRGTAAGS
jgi:nucleoside phosphorylase